MSRIIIALFLLSFCLNRPSAQISYMQKEINSGFVKGLEFYNKEKYPAAIKFFDSYLEKTSSGNIN
ncbi:MAG: hypothetical protein ACUVTX_09700, partial [Bacteroidales bacterium]